MLQLWNELPDNIKGVIVGGLIGVLSGILTAIYTVNKNRRKEKYFKLQQAAEEIIINLWKRQDVFSRYNLENDIRNDQIFLMQGTTPSKYEMEQLDKQTQVVNELADLKKEFHDIFFAKIQVYFSERGLDVVRKRSVALANLIAQHYLEKDMTKKKKYENYINENIISLKDVVIHKVSWYGKSWLFRCICFWA